MGQYMYAAAGFQTTCLIRSDGDVFCRSYEGQCVCPVFQPDADSSGIPLRPNPKLAELLVWSPPFHILFPRASREFVKFLLLLQLRMQQTGIALSSCLICRILSFAVPVILQGWWKSRARSCIENGNTC